MLKRITMSVLLAGAGMLVLLSGCRDFGQPPASTDDGMDALQQRALTVRNVGEEFGASYRDVWFSTIATLQLNGFILKQADMNSGFIYGVWKDTYERQIETTRGGILLMTLSSSPSYMAGIFSSRTAVYKQVDVSVTLERLAPHQTLVRLVSRFDTNGEPVAEGVFANRFFGLLRKEIFLRMNHGSVYHAFSKTTNKEGKIK